MVTFLHEDRLCPGTAFLASLEKHATCPFAFSPLMPLTQALDLHSSGLSIAQRGQRPAWAACYRKLGEAHRMDQGSLQTLDETEVTSGTLGPTAKTWEQSGREGLSTGRC